MFITSLMVNIDIHTLLIGKYTKYMRDHVEAFEHEITKAQYEIYCENGFDLDTEINGELILNRIAENYRDAYRADLEDGKIVIAPIL